MTRERRLALFALLLTVPLPSIGVAAAMIVAPGSIGAAIWSASKLVFFGLPLLWRVAIDRERPSLSPMRRGGLWIGLASGVLLASSLLALHFFIAPHWIDGAKLRELANANGFDSRGAYFAVAVYTVLFNSLLEEYAWRWFVASRLERLVAPRLAIPLSALAFTLHHIVLLVAQFGAKFAAVASIGVFTAGCLWSLFFARYRSIWPGWVSHALVDAALLAIGWHLLFGA